MASTSFSRALPLAGPGGISHSFSTTKPSPFSSTQAASAPASPYRPNKAELEAKLAHAQVRAQARRTIAYQGIGLGLPADLFRPQSRIVCAGNDVPASEWVCNDTVPTHITKLPMAHSSVSPSLPSSPALPFSPELARAGVGSAQFGRITTSTPPSPTLGTQPPPQSLYTVTPHTSPPQRTTDAPGASSFQQSGQATGVDFELVFSPVTQSAFPGPRMGPRRPASISLHAPGAPSPDPIVSPTELKMRNFPLTPGAPLYRPSKESHCLRTLGVTLTERTPADGGAECFHPATTVTTSVGLGIDMGAEPAEGDGLNTHYE
ncbi:uncharacterized protein FIBRA_04310 [Fibroporia radiculosa]|uniref:Uncharacterized protein n=1 Tax=Fibroporia radiculosa TaxID=599839 RepID=J4GP14_9APHY|nr:uncharacterized protein FIBRA_04310 [Fibroporia radiculosa]CCM02230.1 predicted protein [Fibroporia radiculosa]